MNNQLIDQQILDLLRVPAAQRTQAVIADAANRIAAAAELDMIPLGPLQQEHIKLAAIVEFLAIEMNAKNYAVSLDLRSNDSGSYWSLYARLKLDSDNELYGFGNSAEEVLKDLSHRDWR